MKIHRLLATLLGVWLSSSWGFATANPRWRPVQPGKRKGVSGLAFVNQQGGTCQFLAVHDNKGDLDQPRLALLTVPPHGTIQYQPLTWPADQPLPVDLEALTVVPRTQHTEYMAVTSLGQIYHVRLDSPTHTLTVLRSLQIPPHSKLINIEGFALQQMEDQLMAVWAHRGEEEDPAMLFWGSVDLTTDKIAVQGSRSWRVPWPLNQVRHVSDLQIAPDGTLYITAASDPGDQGPFQSAMYVLGRFPFLPSLSRRAAPSEGPDPSTLVPLYRFGFNKVEALALIPGQNGGIVWASDDEKFGSALAGQCHATPQSME
ncbi:hypothetical protein [Acaryochloris sp. IP29b_bin.148]|uniref:hypothetical protein n=1 Tax=Acaryochloris sp. IP29b_bin.148 TaxID=2969218 RepID=UPI0026234B94|nr:hypothetical protein [Acaryochloris sp. IP29b_bin.148]